MAIESKVFPEMIIGIQQIKTLLNDLKFQADELTLESEGDCLAATVGDLIELATQLQCALKS